jgi:hypothetical protein
MLQFHAPRRFAITFSLIHRRNGEAFRRPLPGPIEINDKLRSGDADGRRFLGAAYSPTPSMVVS